MCTVLKNFGSFIQYWIKWYSTFLIASNICISTWFSEKSQDWVIAEVSRKAISLVLSIVNEAVSNMFVTVEVSHGKNGINVNANAFSDWFPNFTNVILTWLLFTVSMKLYTTYVSREIINSVNNQLPVIPPFWKYIEIFHWLHLKLKFTKVTIFYVIIWIVLRHFVLQYFLRKIHSRKNLLHLKSKAQKKKKKNSVNKQLFVILLVWSIETRV